MALSIPKMPDYITDNLGMIGIGTGAFVIGAAAGAVGSKLLGGGSPSFSRTVKRKKTTKRKTARKRKLSPLMKRRKKIIARKGRQTPYTARGRKDRSTKRIRYTKNSQPYVIMASGKAKFISKKAAKSARRRKGGRY